MGSPAPMHSQSIWGHGEKLRVVCSPSNHGSSSRTSSGPAVSQWSIPSPGNSVRMCTLQLHCVRSPPHPAQPPGMYLAALQAQCHQGDTECHSNHTLCSGRDPLHFATWEGRPDLGICGSPASTPRYTWHHARGWRFLWVSTPPSRVLWSNSPGRGVIVEAGHRAVPPGTPC